MSKIMITSPKNTNTQLKSFLENRTVSGDPGRPGAGESSGGTDPGYLGLRYRLRCGSYGAGGNGDVS